MSPIKPTTWQSIRPILLWAFIPIWASPLIKMEYNPTRFRKPPKPPQFEFLVQEEKQKHFPFAYILLLQKKIQSQIIRTISSISWILSSLIILHSSPSSSPLILLIFFFSAQWRATQMALLAAAPVTAPSARRPLWKSHRKTKRRRMRRRKRIWYGLFKFSSVMA